MMMIPMRAEASVTSRSTHEWSQHGHVGAVHHRHLRPRMLEDPSKGDRQCTRAPDYSSGNENNPCLPSWSSQLVGSGLVVILGLLFDDLVL
jgi:hypothetical protein